MIDVIDRDRNSYPRYKKRQLRQCLKEQQTFEENSQNQNQTSSTQHKFSILVCDKL